MCSMRSPHNPDTLVKEHIRLLHRYNEVKDTTQSLIYQVSQCGFTVWSYLRRLVRHHDQYHGHRCPSRTRSAAERVNSGLGDRDGEDRERKGRAENVVS